MKKRVVGGVRKSKAGPVNSICLFCLSLSKLTLKRCCRRPPLCRSHYNNLPSHRRQRRQRRDRGVNRAHEVDIHYLLHGLGCPLRALAAASLVNPSSSTSSTSSSSSVQLLHQTVMPFTSTQKEDVDAAERFQSAGDQGLAGLLVRDVRRARHRLARGSRPADVICQILQPLAISASKDDISPEIATEAASQCCAQALAGPRDDHGAPQECVVVEAAVAAAEGAAAEMPNRSENHRDDGHGEEQEPAETFAGRKGRGLLCRREGGVAVDDIELVVAERGWTSHSGWSSRTLKRARRKSLCFARNS